MIYFLFFQIEILDYRFAIFILIDNTKIEMKYTNLKHISA